jgi:glycosyltransferase involved in cell wall biosynthesis
MPLKPVTSEPEAPNAALDLTIIVPCRNEARYIEAFVQSLMAQELEGYRWEAIIADGESDDGTREKLARCTAGLPVRVIDNPARIVSTGLNQAIREARGRIVLRMDLHTEYAPDYARRCVRALQRTGARNVGGPARTKASGTIGAAIAAAYHSPFSCGGARFHDPSYEGWVDTVTYGCWEKSYLQALGSFDEDLVRNQDDELNLRIIRSGGKIWQDPEIRSWYSPRNSLRALFRQYMQYGFWKVAVIRKHRLPASWRHLVPGAFAAANLLFAAAVAGAALVDSKLAAVPAAGWLAMWAAYMALAAAASVQAARRDGWALLPVLPVVFATFHIAYGLGFLAGLVRWRTFDRPVRQAAFTALSR